MARLLHRIGRFATRRAWAVILLWVLALGGAGAAAAAFSGQLTESVSIPGTATQQVADDLADTVPEAAGGSGTIVFQSEDGEAFTDDQREAVSDAIAQAADADGVELVVDPFETQQQRDDAAQQLEDGRAELEAGREQLEAGQAQLDAAREQLDAQAAQLEASAGMLPAEQYEASLAQIEGGRAQLDEQQATLDSSREELESGEAELERGERQIELAAGLQTVSDDETTAVANVSFTESANLVTQATKDAVVEAGDSITDEGVDVFYSSTITQSLGGLIGPGEIIGLAVAAITLLVMLGTLVAAGLPLLMALVGVGVGALGTLAFSSAVDMSSVTPALGLMLGLAVGIDYSLFILNRHRNQILDGMDVKESIALANGTSGNAVTFAGLTVIIALAALGITGIPFLAVMGFSAAATVAIAVLVAVTLTPALLSLIGGRLVSKRARRRHEATRQTAAHSERKDTRGWGSLVTRHPVLATLASIVVLGIIALPASQMRLGLPDGSTEAADSSGYQAYQAIGDNFGEGVNGPLVVAVTLPDGLGETEATDLQLDVTERVADVEHVSAAIPAVLSEDLGTAVIQVVPTEGPTSVSTEELVHELRGLSDEFQQDFDVEIGVAGIAAANIDVSELLADALPLYLVIVVGLSLILLLMVFRSILVPLLATGGFVLSILATFGAVTAIYQWGWLAPVFGVNEPGPILSFLPTLVVGVLFGLAMDYQMFLVSGMREAYVHGADARSAILSGYRAGSRVVVAAAIIMIAVFAGFVFSHLSMIRPMGFALAFGVLVDAFVIRMTLTPAIMQWFGDKAWWLPKWLDRILPSVDVEGDGLRRQLEKERAATAS